MRCICRGKPLAFHASAWLLAKCWASKSLAVPTPNKHARHRSTSRCLAAPPLQGPIPKIPLAELAKRSAVGMVAGGTGITPMLQVAEEVLLQKLPVDVTLVYANVSRGEEGEWGGEDGFWRKAQGRLAKHRDTPPEGELVI